MYDLYSILANHQATRKVGCQLGECRSSLNIPTGISVGMYEYVHTHLINPGSQLYKT